MEIELYILEPTIPINTLPVLKRIEKLLEESKTNSLISLTDGKHDNERAMAKGCVMILWEQLMMDWDFIEELKQVKKELQPHLIAEKIKA